MVNSLVCAKVHNPTENNTAVMLSSASAASTAAAMAAAASSSHHSNVNEDDKTSPTVKMEVLDDLFNSYGWDESNSMAAAVAAAAGVNNFSLLGATSTISPKCTVKVPMASEADLGSPSSYVSSVDAAFSPPPMPNLAVNIPEQPLRVIIPSPLPPGPDSSTNGSSTGSPASAAASNIKTPGSTASAATPGVASSSSSKKTVFTAKGNNLGNSTRKGQPQPFRVS